MWLSLQSLRCVPDEQKNDCLHFALSFCFLSSCLCLCLCIFGLLSLSCLAIFEMCSWISRRVPDQQKTNCLHHGCHRRGHHHQCPADDGQKETKTWETLSAIFGGIVHHKPFTQGKVRRTLRKQFDLISHQTLES